ncbi:MAG: thioredoxin family protein [Gudongella sp.]|nr:thioredoxin family protein [Gudongella sp.]
MVIKILGTGCDKCDKAFDNAQKAVNELGESVVVEKVEDLVTMIKYGILTTPGIVVDEEVLATGRIPTVEDFKNIILDR